MPPAIRHLRSLLAAALPACLALGGCSGPVTDASFGHPYPPARIAAAERAANANDRTALGPMIEMLESDDPAERIVAIQGLESMTGLTQGFDHSDPPAARRAAVARWRKWLSEQPPATQSAKRA